MKNKIAVAVGYVFGFVSKEALKHVSLKEVGEINFHGDICKLYKAETFEGSKEIDVLLNYVTEYQIKDYQI